LEHCATFRILPKRTIRIPDEVGRPRTWGLRLRHCNRMTVRRGHIGENPKIIRISSKRELTALCSCRISKFQVIYIFIRINCSYKNKKIKKKQRKKRLTTCQRTRAAVETEFLSPYPSHTHRKSCYPKILHTRTRTLSFHYKRPILICSLSH